LKVGRFLVVIWVIGLAAPAIGQTARMAWFNGKGIYAHGCEKPWEWRAYNKAGR
jgi:hypothetical protein